MIFLHELHEVIGGKMADFKAAVLTEWRTRVAAHGDARLLWLWERTHGTGPSYEAVSIVALADWAAWGRFVERRRADGDLGAWDRGVCTLRREVTGKLLAPTVWSPLQSVALDTADLLPHGGALYLHDTGWPFPGKLDAYANALGTIFYPQVKQSRMISIEACWTVVPGTGRFHEVVLLQRIANWEAFSHLLTSGERPSRASDWMEQGLTFRDRWESRLLRPA